MIDIKTGDINVGGLIIGKKFKKEDALNLSEEIAKVETSIKGDIFVTFKRKYDGASIEIDIWNDESPNEIEIIPELLVKEDDTEKVTRGLLEESRKWLQKHIAAAPSANSKDGIVYKFEWGKIIATCYEDLHYGLIGGQIKVTYRS